MPQKFYLGDGVYLTEGSYQGELILTTENGTEEPTNIIVFEPEVLYSFVRTLQRLGYNIEIKK